MPFEGGWVQCDVCGRWCHGECAGLDRQQAEETEHYTCRCGVSLSLLLPAASLSRSSLPPLSLSRSPLPPLSSTAVAASLSS